MAGERAAIETATFKFKITTKTLRYLGIGNYATMCACNSARNRTLRANIATKRAHNSHTICKTDVHKFQIFVPNSGIPALYGRVISRLWKRIHHASLFQQPQTLQGSYTTSPVVFQDVSWPSTVCRCTTLFLNTGNGTRHTRTDTVTQRFTNSTTYRMWPKFFTL